VPNKPTALKALLRALPAQSCIAMEATGNYHQCLADLAHQLGLRVHVLNPRDLYHYAKGVGMRAKTDRVDAALIARFLANEGARLRPYQPATAEQRKVDQLLRRRAKIVSLRTALQLTCADAPSIRREMASLLKGFAALLEKIDRQLAELQEAKPERARELKRLQSIPGVGPLTACWLANLMDRSSSETVMPWWPLPAWTRVRAIPARSAASDICPSAGPLKGDGCSLMPPWLWPGAPHGRRATRVADNRVGPARKPS
jgi:transposase